MFFRKSEEIWISTAPNTATIEPIAPPIIVEIQSGTTILCTEMLYKIYTSAVKMDKNTVKITYMWVPLITKLIDRLYRKIRKVLIVKLSLLKGDCLEERVCL